MKTTTQINPEDYILSALSAEDRLEAAFEIARKVFRKTGLALRDIEKAVAKVRRKTYGTGKRPSSR